MPAVGRQLRGKMPALWFENSLVILLASFLDWAIGDPWGWPHPVQAMGRVISWITHGIIKAPLPAWGERLLGIGLGIILIGGSGLVGWLLVLLADGIHSGIGLAVKGVLLASCFAGRSLRRAAEEVLLPLETGDLATARQKIGLYVGRDTADLDPPEILRAVMETISENATDGVTAPLFYALAGAWVGPVGIVPLALAYKAASTLDSMVGYRAPPYRHLGWFSARCEDVLTWIPCRLTVLTIALLSRQPFYVYRVCRRDAPADPSPNAGWSECAYAAALGIQLGGINRYGDQVKVKPKLGNDLNPITPETVRRGLGLTRRVVLLWLVLGLFPLGLLGLMG